MTTSASPLLRTRLPLPGVWEAVNTPSSSTSPTVPSTYQSKSLSSVARVMCL